LNVFGKFLANGPTANENEINKILPREIPLFNTTINNEKLNPLK